MRRRSWLLVLVPSACLIACSQWDPRTPFEREAPQVKQATEAYDAGDAQAAASLLEDYLGTGACKEGSIGTPGALAQRREGTFDLGLALFAVAEAFGARLQDDQKVQARGGDPKKRAEMIACALRIVRAVFESPEADFSLRARAAYLEGNLHFLSGSYAEAIKAYERALLLVPGQGDAGDHVGRDAAWNRAVAMRRLEDQKDAGPDGGNTDGGGGDGGDASAEGGSDDGGSDGGGDQNKDGGADGGGKEKDDKKKNDKDQDKKGKQKDGGANSGQNEKKQEEPNERDNSEEDAGGAKQESPPQPSEPQQQQGQSASPDERVLDSLERAPLLQHEISRRQSQTRKVRGSADK